MKVLGLLIAASAALLTACGGGGGSGSTESTASASTAATPSVGSAGIWAGGLDGALVTPSGEFWAVQRWGKLYFVAHGSIAESGSTFTGSATSYPYYQPNPATVGGSFTAGKSISATLTNSLATQYLNGTYQAIYDASPSLSDMSGTWIVDGGSVVVAPNGDVIGSQAGCAFSGSVSPDASGKNFYRLSLTFSGSACLRPNAKMSGVVAPITTRTAMAGLADGSNGFAFFLSR